MAKIKNCENLSNFKRPRRTCSTLTLENQFKVIQLLKEDKSERCFAEITGVFRSQINRISKSREKIEHFFQDKVFQPKAKVMVNRSLNANLDIAVHNWFREMRNPLGRHKLLSLSRTITAIDIKYSGGYCYVF
jgi:uncharacterized protein YerC